MGVMRFLVLPPEAANDWPEAALAYVTGLDGRVFPSRVNLNQNVLTCTRHTSESGKLHVPWPVEGFGCPVLTTASLPESDAPYLLALELARGKIGELRDQVFQWQFAGMAIPPDFQALLREAFHLFSKASSLREQPLEASQWAQQALARACAAVELLGRSYTRQRVNSRRMLSTHPPALLGCTLDESACAEPLQSEFFDTFSAAAVPIEWTRVEPTEGSYQWQALDDLVECCHRHRGVVRGGPLIDLSQGGLPGWLGPWGEDFLNLQSFVCDFIETAVTRYAGRIRIWEVSARGNTGGVLSLTEEQRLALTARTLEAAQRTDADSQLFIRIDRPWGEYQAAGTSRLSPFQFVDALVRSRLGLSGVSLDFAFGYHPDGDRYRDLLSMSRLIDLWSLLGLQIHVNLAFPSSTAVDEHAAAGLAVGPPQYRSAWDESEQAAWIDDFVGLLISKPHVTGVFWSHFHDGVPHRFPNAGLVRPDGTPKPALHSLRRHQETAPTPDDTSEDLPAVDPDGTWIDDD
jgi:hypothetical protein